MGTIADEPYGHDGAAQYGLALSLPLTKRLTSGSGQLRGPQPGTPDKYGAVLSDENVGFASVASIVDAACTRAYTVGTPRQEITAGITYSIKPGI